MSRGTPPESRWTWRTAPGVKSRGVMPGTLPGAERTAGHDDAAPTLWVGRRRVPGGQPTKSALALITVMVIP